MIANFNVEHSYELSGTGVRLDITYLRELGPSAIPALDHYLHAEASSGRQGIDARLARSQLADDFAQRQRDWRSWSFRDARMANYLLPDANGCILAREC